MLTQKLLKALFIFLLPALCFGQKVDRRRDVEKRHLVGKVKYVKFETYYGKEIEGKIVLGHRTHYEGGENYFVKFDEKGNIIDIGESYPKTTEDTIKPKKNYYYRNQTNYNDSITNLFRKYKTAERINELYSLNSEGIFDLKTIDVFDTAGVLLEKSEYYAKDSTNYKETFEYDGHGYLVENDNWKNGMLRSKEINKRIDKNTFLSSFITIEENDTATAKYTYNDNGDMLENIQYRRDGNIWSIENFTYDKKGYLIERMSINFENDSLTEKDVCAYSADYLKKEKVFYVNDVKGGRFIETIDKNKNLLEETFYNEKNEIYDKQIREYEYDEKGNWTKMIRTTLMRGFKDGKIIFPVKKCFITLREITYY